MCELCKSKQSWCNNRAVILIHLCNVEKITDWLDEVADELDEATDWLDEVEWVKWSYRLVRLSRNFGVVTTKRNTILKIYYFPELKMFS